MNTPTLSLKAKIIIIAAIILICGGTYAVARHRVRQVAVAVPIVTDQQPAVLLPDPACDGDADEYADIGLGVEHTYTGAIKEDMPVQIVLSCDQRRFTVTGSVSQVITAEDIGKANGNPDVDFTDTANGDQNIITVSKDYNFDGYNDMDALAVNGSQLDTYNIFLYDPATHTFVYNKELSAITNIDVDKVKKQVTKEGECIVDEHSNVVYDKHGEPECQYDRYQWINGQLKQISAAKPLSR